MTKNFGDLTTLVGRLGINDADTEIRGAGDAILLHPLAALTWLVNPPLHTRQSVVHGAYRNARQRRQNDLSRGRVYHRSRV